MSVFNFPFCPEYGPLFLEQMFTISIIQVPNFLYQNGEERISYQFQSTKYWCEPLVSKFVGVPNTLTS